MLGMDRTQIITTHRPAFYWYLASRCASLIVYQMVAVAIGWQIYELTHRAFDLGLVGLVQFIPSALLVLVVGHAADRYDRRRIILFAQLLEATVVLALAAATFSHRINRDMIFTLVFLLGTARAFELTTMQAFIPSLVEQEELPKAMAVTASVTQASIIVGPMVGGFLYVIGPATVYGVSCALFLFSAAATTVIKSRHLVASRERVAMQTIFAGIAFIRSQPVLLGAISFDLFAVLLGGATALLPIYARDILFASPRGLGLLRAAPAAGAFIASLWLAHHPLRNKIGRLMFLSVTCFGLATIVFALSTDILLSFLALVVLGGFDMVSVVIRALLVQLETPAVMRGRVSAVNSVFIGASNQLGEFESGLTAAWFGVVPATLIGGLGTLTIVILWIFLFPQLAKRDKLLPE